MSQAQPRPGEVALFGGSFDPPHLGHVAIVAHVLATEPVEQVWLIPCYVHPFGKVTSPFELRVRMLRAAMRPFGQRAVVETIEATLPSPSYTVDTVRALRAREPDRPFAFVSGADVARELPRWKEAQALQDLVRWITLPRRGEPRDPEDPPYLLPWISSSEVRARARAGLDLRHWVPWEVAQILHSVRPYRGRSEPDPSREA